MKNMKKGFIKADTFLPLNVRELTKEDWQNAFDRLNIDFFTPIVGLLDESKSEEDSIANLRKVNFEIENPSELEKCILSIIRVYK